MKTKIIGALAIMLLQTVKANMYAVPFQIWTAYNDWEDITISPSVDSYIYSTTTRYWNLTRFSSWYVWQDEGGGFHYQTIYYDSNGNFWNDEQPFQYGTGTSLPLTKRQYECKIGEHYSGKSDSSLTVRITHIVNKPAMYASTVTAQFSGYILFIGDNWPAGCDGSAFPGSAAHSFTVSRRSKIRFPYEATNLVIDNTAIVKQ